MHIAIAMHPATILCREKSRGYDNSEGVALVCVCVRLHFESRARFSFFVVEIPVRKRERQDNCAESRRVHAIEATIGGN